MIQPKVGRRITMYSRRVKEKIAFRVRQRRRIRNSRGTETETMKMDSNDVDDVFSQIRLLLSLMNHDLLGYHHQTLLIIVTLISFLQKQNRPSRVFTILFLTSLSSSQPLSFLYSSSWAMV
jgi:hypothetical protein